MIVLHYLCAVIWVMHVIDENAMVSSHKQKEKKEKEEEKMRIILIVLATRTNRLHNMVSRIDMNQNGKCCTHSLALSLSLSLLLLGRLGSGS